LIGFSDLLDKRKASVICILKWANLKYQGVTGSQDSYAQIHPTHAILKAQQYLLLYYSLA